MIAAGLALVLLAQAANPPPRRKHARITRAQTAPAVTGVDALSIGLEKAGGVFEAVFPPDTQLPASRSFQVTTSQDGQKELAVRVYRGNAPQVDDDQLLGDVRFHGLRPAQAGALRLEIALQLDRQGALSVSARDLETGQPLQAGVRTEAPAAVAAAAALPALAAVPAVAAEPQGDVVEAMALPGMPAPSLSPAILAPPPPTAGQDRVQLRGFWRALGEGGLARSPVNRDALALPFDGAGGNAQLFIEAAAAHGPFEARASGLASYSFAARTSAGAESAVGTLGTSRGSWEPELREAYVSYSAGPLDLRIGQQRVAWGRADSNSPNDVVNARDMRDPLMERELQHLPTPMARADIALGPATLELIASPVFVPDRIDLYGTNWALTQPGAPGLLRGVLNAALGPADPSQLEQLQPLLAATSLPARNLTQPEGGARLGFSGGGVDLAAYWFTGFDGMPVLAFNPQVAFAMAQAGPAAVSPAVLLQVLRQLSAPLYTATYVRRQHFGADFGTTAGPFGLRLDGAYDSKHVFLDSTLNGFVAPTLSGTASVEYQTGELGKVVLVELNATRITDSLPAPGLLFYQGTTWTAAGELKWTFFERLELEMRGQVGLRPESYVLHPQASLKLPRDVWLRAGAIVPWGATDSLGGWFHRSRAVYVALQSAL